MRNMLKMILGTVFTSVMAMNSSAADLKICVFDIMGSNGDMMAVAKDYALAAKPWGVNIEPQVYTSLDDAVSDFESKKCQGVIADNYVMKKYNNFAGSIGAVGAINDYDLAKKVLIALGSPKLASKMKTKDHEVVGMVPFGLAYFFSKDKSINSLEKMAGKRLGVLKDDPSQQRMAKRVGIKPVFMTFDNAIAKYKNGDMDIVPAPLIVYKPFEVGKLVGSQGGVADFPIALMTMSVVFHRGEYPADFGQKSRKWFAGKQSQFIKMVERWDATVPKNIMYEIPEIDRKSSDLLLSQLRKEFIADKTYDGTMITLIRHLRCNQEPNFIECKK